MILNTNWLSVQVSVRLLELYCLLALSICSCLVQVDVFHNISIVVGEPFWHVCLMVLKRSIASKRFWRETYFFHKPVVFGTELVFFFDLVLRVFHSPNKGINVFGVFCAVELSRAAFKGQVIWNLMNVPFKFVKGIEVFHGLVLVQLALRRVS